MIQVPSLVLGLEDSPIESIRYSPNWIGQVYAEMESSQKRLVSMVLMWGQWVPSNGYPITLNDQAQRLQGAGRTGKSGQTCRVPHFLSWEICQWRPSSGRPHLNLSCVHARHQLAPQWMGCAQFQEFASQQTNQTNIEQTVLITYCVECTRLRESILVLPHEANEKLNFPGTE